MGDRYAGEPEMVGSTVHFFSTPEFCLMAVGLRHGGKFYTEGSTGMERTAWISTDDGPVMIAHMWERPRAKTQKWGLRLARRLG